MKKSEIKKLSMIEINECIRIISIILSQLNNSEIKQGLEKYLTREEKEKIVFDYFNKNIFS